MSSDPQTVRSVTGRTARRCLLLVSCIVLSACLEPTHALSPEEINKRRASELKLTTEEVENAVDNVSNPRCKDRMLHQTNSLAADNFLSRAENTASRIALREAISSCRGKAQMGTRDGSSYLDFFTRCDDQVGSPELDRWAIWGEDIAYVDGQRAFDVQIAMRFGEQAIAPAVNSAYELDLSFFLDKHKGLRVEKFDDLETIVSGSYKGTAKDSMCGELRATFRPEFSVGASLLGLGIFGVSNQVHDVRFRLAIRDHLVPGADAFIEENPGVFESYKLSISPNLMCQKYDGVLTYKHPDGPEIGYSVVDGNLDNICASCMSTPSSSPLDATYTWRCNDKSSLALVPCLACGDGRQDLERWRLDVPNPTSSSSIREQLLEELNTLDYLRRCGVVSFESIGDDVRVVCGAPAPQVQFDAARSSQGTLHLEVSSNNLQRRLISKGVILATQVCVVDFDGEERNCQLFSPNTSSIKYRSDPRAPSPREIAISYRVRDFTSPSSDAFVNALVSERAHVYLSDALGQRCEVPETVGGWYCARNGSLAIPGLIGSISQEAVVKCCNGVIEEIIDCSPNNLCKIADPNFHDHCEGVTSVLNCAGQPRSTVPHTGPTPPSDPEAEQCLEDTVHHPVDGATSPNYRFNDPNYPDHKGLDYSRRCGTDIYLPITCEVTFVQDGVSGRPQTAEGEKDICWYSDGTKYCNTGGEGALGNQLRCLDDRGTWWFFGHMEKGSVLQVEPGTRLEAGTRIGKVGNSGRTGGPTGCHVHVQSNIGNEAYDHEYCLNGIQASTLCDDGVCDEPGPVGCGDDVCEPGEDASTCSPDCSGAMITLPTGGTYETEDVLELRWISSLPPTTAMIISLKRNAHQGGGEDVDYVRFTEDARNDGAQSFTIPPHINPATDWRVYVRPRGSSVYAVSREITITRSSSCIGECPNDGETRCDGSGYKVCGDFDGDSCLEWSAITACAANQECLSGQCVNTSSCGDGTCDTNEDTSSCPADCQAPVMVSVTAPTTGTYEVGDSLEVRWTSNVPANENMLISLKRSIHQGSSENADYVRLTTSTPNDGVEIFTIPGHINAASDWRVYVRPSTSSEFDTSGLLTITQSPSCMNGCGFDGQIQCSGSGYRTCGDHNNDGCLEWSTTLMCPTNQTCSGDQCINTCGNGICDSNENSIDCQADCQVAPECTGGPCCSPSGTFQPSTFPCAHATDERYVCPDGESSGDDVYVEIEDRFCSGSSSSCDGDYRRSSPIHHIGCDVGEACEQGQSSCQTVCEADGVCPNTCSPSSDPDCAQCTASQSPDTRSCNLSVFYCSYEREERSCSGGQWGAWGACESPHRYEGDDVRGCGSVVCMKASGQSGNAIDLEISKQDDTKFANDIEVTVLTSSGQSFYFGCLGADDLASVSVSLNASQINGLVYDSFESLTLEVASPCNSPAIYTAQGASKIARCQQ